MTQTSITRSWVASANGHADFPLQNLPLGVFSLNGSAPRAGVAIGEHIFDLQVALEAGLFDGAARLLRPRSRGPRSVAQPLAGIVQRGQQPSRRH